MKTGEIPPSPEERAVELIRNAKLETDEDHVALVKLIDDAVAEEFGIDPVSNW